MAIFFHNNLYYCFELVVIFDARNYFQKPKLNKVY